MISKDIIKNVEAFELKSVTGHYKAHDIYTLHFRQWWKKARTFQMPRIISNQDFEKETFSHSMSDESIITYDLLKEHILDTYKDKPEKPEVVKKDNVFEIKFNKKETDT